MHSFTDGWVQVHVTCVRALHGAGCVSADAPSRSLCKARAASMPLSRFFTLWG